MKYLVYTILIIIAFGFTGCNYLDAVPEKDIQTVESIFEQRKGAEQWRRGLYASANLLFADACRNMSFFGADELVVNEYMKNDATVAGIKISEGLQMAQTPYGDVWASVYNIIRDCNTFLDNIDNVYNMKNTEKRMWEADVKALKAYLYFELVRRYGPIVLVPENLPADADIQTLQLPRMHVDTCFNTIVTLLDEAIEYLPAGNIRESDEFYTFAEEAAYALKARVLLYAASPLFNGNAFYSDFKGKNGEVLFSTTYDKEKWRLAAEAADKAVAVCLANGRDLYGGNTTKGSELLNKMYAVEHSMSSSFDNPEFLLEWEWRNHISIFTMPRLVNDEKNLSSQLYGNVAPSMTMVEMYYTEHGLPIDQDNAWSYANRYKLGKESSGRYKDVVSLDEDVLQLHLRREPRFYACIGADRCYWQRGKDNPAQGIDYTLLIEARKGEKWGTNYNILTSVDYQNITGYWSKKHSFSEYSTRDYISVLSTDPTYPVIRLAEVYLIQAEAWNEYLDRPDYRVYDALDKVRERAGIPKVRQAWQSYGKNSMKVETKEGMRDIIRQEINIEFAFEGHRFWNVRRWLTAVEEFNHSQLGWNVLGASASEFYNRYDMPIELPGMKCKFTAPRDYLFPIRAEEILISGVVQNPGW